MAKKRQHIVPKVYLQPFLDHTRPEGWPKDTRLLLQIHRWWKFR